MRHFAPGFLALALGVSAAALAEQAVPAPQPAQAAPPAATAPLPDAGLEEPPTRVGRVSFVSGQLGFRGKSDTAWSAGSVNYPVATGASFWTDAKARAEFRIGAETINLSNNTEIDIVRLDQQVLQLAVPQGRIELHLRRLGEGNTVEVDIPRGGVWLLQPGIYDIDAGSPNQPSRIIVFEGSARFVGGTLDMPIKAGEAAVISGTETLTVAMEKAAPDAFVAWCRSRDYHEEKLAAPYYVSRRMTGYEALDEYGAWRAVPDYGEVWFPGSVPANWAPYRNGYWSWVEPWGWNWIAAEPWGFAPFHYGRWAYVGGAWGWAPGAFVTYPVYAPALVAFVGDPAAIVAARIAGALTGWFPLGPGEAYWPSYTSDAGYIRAVNAGVVADARTLADPANASRAIANRGAATVVTQRAFAAGRSVAHTALPVSAAAAQQARVTAQAPAATRGGRGALTAARGSSASAGRASRAARMSAVRGDGRAFRGGGMAFHGGGKAFRGGGRAFRGGGMAFHGGGGHGGGRAFHGSGGGGPHGGGGVAFQAGGGGGGGGGSHGGGGGGPHGGGGGHHGGGGKGHG